MTQRFVITGRLPSLNDYVNAERGNRYAGAAMKRDAQTVVLWAIRAAGIKPIERLPVIIKYTYYEKDERRDAGNIHAFADKVIEDALVEAGVLPDDGRKCVRGFDATFAVDRARPRIEVTIEEDEG